MAGRKTHSKATIKKVFEKLKTIKGEDPNVKRKDRCSITVCYSAYGDEDSKCGWNIHHKDGDPENNKINNLEGVSYKTHHIIHE